MLGLPDYQILEEVHSSDNTVIYRGFWKSQQQSVIIKALKNEFPTLEEISLLKHEYQITKYLDIESIVKTYSLENSGNGLALILEDFGGISIKNLLLFKKLELLDFLQIAIQLATILSKLHENKIIHKDIKSSNIIINPETWQVKLTDFAIASNLSNTTQQLSISNVLEGTLAYISPEQTGRTNCPIDYRTDYYSLGVTFYEMLVGKLPFTATDAMELIHSHIARKAIPPHEIVSTIPLALSEIVMKLLAKNADNRYQSTLALKNDLDFCLSQLQTKGAITHFNVDKQDLPYQTVIKQNIRHQEQEKNKSEVIINVILNSWELFASTGNSFIVKIVIFFQLLRLRKIILCYLFEKYIQALDNEENISEYLIDINEQEVTPLFYLYSSLSLLFLYPSLTEQGQKLALLNIDKNQREISHFAHINQINCSDKLNLVQAEKNRVLGRNYEAMDYYDKAILAAAEHGYIKEEAFASELAAKFYLTMGKQKIAKTYMTDAYYCYIRWGAVVKVKDLESKYPQLLSQITTRVKTEISVTKTTKSTLTTESLAALDLSSVIKVSQAISEEIIFDKLLDKLMQIVMENAGAGKGLFFLYNRSQLILAADVCVGHVGTEKKVNLPFVPIEECLDIPFSIIDYVEKNQQPVLLNNAFKEGLFTNDTYILKQQPISVLGLPIIYQGKLTGILYLENNLTEAAFTRSQLKILSLLGSQIAISIENAALYKDLQNYSHKLEVNNVALQQSEVREREKASELETALQELQNTQLQLVQSEKMSSLGQMVAGIAHEINNPLNFISVNVNYASNYTQDLLHLINLYQQSYPQPVAEIQEEIDAMDLQFIQQDLPKMFSSLKMGSDRIKEIVRNLRNFSRQDATERTLEDIHEAIDTTLMILQHRLKAQSKRPEIEIIKEYSDLPMVLCYSGLLNQVFMNILANAIDALEESTYSGEDSGQHLIDLEVLRQPKIKICTEILNNNWVIIRIADNGCGITEEVREKLFNPFFTTKPAGKGTGIGLSISHQIVVDKHGGNLKCVSTPGEGTEFIIEIPM